MYTILSLAVPLLLIGCSGKDAGDTGATSNPQTTDSTPGDDTGPTGTDGGATDSGATDDGATDDTGPTDTDGGTTGGTTDDTGGSGDSLPDPTQGFDEGHCQDIFEIPGATVYWAGEFRYAEGDSVVGREYQLYFATTQWEDIGGEDCAVVFDMTGTYALGGDADVSLSVSAVMNEDETDCPAAFWEGGETWTGEYLVTFTGDSGAEFAYDDGEIFGVGVRADAGVIYQGDSTCAWF